jgi:peptide/nickel transport system substrate-binding protein
VIKPVIQLSTNASYVDIGEFFAKGMAKIGLDVQVDISPPSTLRQSISTGKVSFSERAWIADYPDAENYLSLFYSKNFSRMGQTIPILK